MDPINSVGQSATQAAQAVQAGQANTAAGTSQTKSPPSGLPPVNLAHPASTNALSSAGIAVDPLWGRSA